jgi:altered-inheritance-of-mitochondria protein 5
VTVTLGLAYLTILAHERNRQAQGQALRSQARVLNGLLEPAPISPPQSRADLAREERSTLVEAAKDRWNAELENAVRWVQRTDWSEVREGMEGAVARLLGGGLQKSQDGIAEAEKQAPPKVKEAIDRAAAAAVSGAEKAEAEAVGSARRLSESTKSAASKAIASSKEELEVAEAKAAEYRDAAKSSAQDVAESIKDAVSKGIETGKEAIGKVQEAVGLGKEAAESQVQSLSNASAVERALHERYEKPHGLEKTVEEVLAERYQPLDSRDNTVLRGV